MYSRTTRSQCKGSTRSSTHSHSITITKSLFLRRKASHRSGVTSFSSKPQQSSSSSILNLKSHLYRNFLPTRCTTCIARRNLSSTGSSSGMARGPTCSWTRTPSRSRRAPPRSLAALSSKAPPLTNLSSRAEATRLNKEVHYMAGKT